MSERATARFYINKIDRDRGDVAFLARVKNISETGMYLYKLIEPTLGEQTVVGQAATHQEQHKAAFNVEMQLPGQDDVIWAEVEVVRLDHTTKAVEGYAVRFSRIAESDRALIGEFVADTLSQPGALAH